MSQNGANRRQYSRRESSSSRHDKVSEAEEILCRAGANIGMPQERLRRIVDRIVYNEYIKTSKRLASLKSRDWEDLGVPMGLRDEIREILEVEPSVAGSSTGRRSQSPPRESRRSSRADTSRNGYSPPRRQRSTKDYSNLRDLPPPANDEIEWVIDDFLEFREACTNNESRVYCPSKSQLGHKFELCYHPSSPNGNPLFALDVTPEEGEDGTWKASNGVEMAALNWRDWKESMLRLNDRVEGTTLIWDELVTKESIDERETIGPKGQLYLRIRLLKPSQSKGVSFAV